MKSSTRWNGFFVTSKASHRSSLFLGERDISFELSIPSRERQCVYVSIKLLLELYFTLFWFQTLIGHGDAINALSTNPKVNSIMASASKDLTVRIWHCLTSTSLAILGGFAGHRDQILTVVGFRKILELWQASLIFRTFMKVENTLLRVPWITRCVSGILTRIKTYVIESLAPQPIDVSTTWNPLKFISVMQNPEICIQITWIRFNLLDPTFSQRYASHFEEFW